jgi:hypothetical protein
MSAPFIRLLGSVTLSSACVGLQFEDSASTSGGQAGASTSTSVGAAGSGGGGAGFVVPAGWLGPVLVGDGCDGAADSLDVITSFVSENTCTCACTVEGCQPYVAKYSTACENEVATVPVTRMGQCVSVADAQSIRVEIQNAACSAAGTPSEVTRETVSVCSSPLGECIYATEASAPCPTGFPNRGPSGVLALADTRSCGECSCSVQQCELMAKVTNPECKAKGFMIQEGGCLVGFDAVEVSWQPATCSAPAAIPASGSVAGVDPISVCCR